jgi:hypothetical protein
MFFECFETLFVFKIIRKRDCFECRLGIFFHDVIRISTEPIRSALDCRLFDDWLCHLVCFLSSGFDFQAAHVSP